MLIVCDVEGTIFQAKYKIQGTDYASSMWQPIAHALGSKAENEEFETHLKWDNEEYKTILTGLKRQLLSIRNISSERLYFRDWLTMLNICLE